MAGYEFPLIRQLLMMRLNQAMQERDPMYQLQRRAAEMEARVREEEQKRVSKFRQYVTGLDVSMLRPEEQALYKGLAEPNPGQALSILQSGLARNRQQAGMGLLMQGFGKESPGGSVMTPEDIATLQEYPELQEKALGYSPLSITPYQREELNIRRTEAGTSRMTAERMMKATEAQIEQAEITNRGSILKDYGIAVAKQATNRTNILKQYDDLRKNVMENISIIEKYREVNWGRDRTKEEVEQEIKAGQAPDEVMAAWQGLQLASMTPREFVEQYEDQETKMYIQSLNKVYKKLYGEDMIVQAPTVAPSPPDEQLPDWEQQAIQQLQEGW